LSAESEEPEPLDEVNKLLKPLSLVSLLCWWRRFFSEENVEEYAYLLLFRDATVGELEEHTITNYPSSHSRVCH